MVYEDVHTYKATPDYAYAETLMTGKHHQNQVEHFFLCAELQQSGIGDFFFFDKPLIKVPNEPFCLILLHAMSCHWQQSSSETF